MAKITRRTGKTDKMGGIVSAIMAGAFALFGFFIPTHESGPYGGSSFDSMDGMIVGFKVLWIVVCSAICIYSVFMAVKGEGISKETVDIDSNGDPLIHVQVPHVSAQPETSYMDFDEKLRKLKKLKDDGIITNDEYALKRGEIMDEKW